MISIQDITGESGELDIVRVLFKEYLSELDEDLCFQSFDEEIEKPLKKYGPPAGSLLLAYWNNEPAGCIALQPLSEQACEMKRLFVRPQYRKFGLGEELVKKIIERGREKGYKKMVLDSLERLQPAIKLYLKHGFENTSAYYTNPLPNVVYMEKLL